MKDPPHPLSSSAPPSPSERREGYEYRRQKVDKSLPLGEDYKRIGIFGSVDLNHPESEALCKAIGLEISISFRESVVLLTGANAAVHELISRTFHSEMEEKDNRIFHLAPKGYVCDWNFGTCLKAGRNAKERRSILATLSDVCIAVEGGPGTADEMNLALQAGKVVVPVSRSGGASNGMFGAPTISRPKFVEEGTWKLLSDEKASIEATAKAVALSVKAVLDHQSKYDVIKRYRRTEAIENAVRSNLGASYVKRPTLPSDCPAYVQPTLAGVAHKVFWGKDWNPNASLGDVYLGPKEAATNSVWSDIKNARITGIVNCTHSKSCSFKGAVQYCNVAVNDECGADILVFLDGVTCFIHSFISKGTNVLVHCQQGISRSATCVIAYLVRFHDMSRDDAYLHVKARRPRASPNPGFWDQLRAFEARCRGRADKAESQRLFGAEWAKASNALHATCHESAEVIRENELHLWFAEILDKELLEKTLTVCLDFIWGRGVLDIDLNWLAYVCRSIRELRPDTAASLPGPEDVIRRILRDERAAFLETWAGEVYEPQIVKVLTTLEL